MGKVVQWHWVFGGEQSAVYRDVRVALLINLFVLVMPFSMNGSDQVTTPPIILWMMYLGLKAGVRHGFYDAPARAHFIDVASA